MSVLLHWINPSLLDAGLLEINFNKNHKNHACQINFTLNSQRVNNTKGFAKERSLWKQERDNSLWNLVKKRSPTTEKTGLWREATSWGPAASAADSANTSPCVNGKKLTRIKLMNELKSAESEKTPAPQGHRPPWRIFGWLHLYCPSGHTVTHGITIYPHAFVLKKQY